MKTLILILIIAAFLQTTIIPVDLVLLILICRAYIKSDRSNLYIGFAYGLLIAHLNLNVLGIQSLIYISFVQVTQMLSKIRLTGNPLLIVPLTLTLLSLNRVINSLLSHTTWEFSGVILAAFLSLPTLYLIRFWEDRFIVQKGIKLKI